MGYTFIAQSDCLGRRIQALTYSVSCFSGLHLHRPIGLYPLQPSFVQSFRTQFPSIDGTAVKNTSLSTFIFQIHPLSPLFSITEHRRICLNHLQYPNCLFHNYLARIP